MKNKLTAQEALEILKENDNTMTIQKLYSFRDSATNAKNPRKPVAQRGTDWDYQGGRTYFSQEYIDTIKNWRENSNSVKAKRNNGQKSDAKAFVIVDGNMTELKGGLAQRAIKLVEKNKAQDQMIEDQPLENQSA